MTMNVAMRAAKARGGAYVYHSRKLGQWTVLSVDTARDLRIEDLTQLGALYVARDGTLTKPFRA
jgi:hypothetical protein